MAARAEYAGRLEQETRTVHLTGPAAAFGPTVPACDSRFEVDLDDPRLTVRNRPTGAGGIVSGQTRQVSRAVPGTGWTSYESIPAGTTTDGLDAVLFVVLVIDRQHCA